MTSHRPVLIALFVIGCALTVWPWGSAAAQQAQDSPGSIGQEIRQLSESVKGARQDILVVQRTQARTMATVEELQKVVQTVDAKLEEFNHRLRELAKRLDALKLSMAQRQALETQEPSVPAAEAPEAKEPEAAEAPGQKEGEEAETAKTAEDAKAEVMGPPSPFEEGAEGTPAQPEAAQPPPQAGPITRQTVEVAVLDPGEVFRAAHEDYVKGNYDLAILGFRDYLKKYPETEQASAAQYWLGECYLSQEEYSKAVEEFQQLLDMYPTSPKVPNALYKQGLAYRELKQYEKARANLEAVVSQFPTSVEAKQADEELKALSTPE